MRRVVLTVALAAGLMRPHNRVAQRLALDAMMVAPGLLAVLSPPR